MLKIVALCFFATSSICVGQTWMPYDADLEATHAVSKDAYLKIDSLTPSQSGGHPHSTMQCAVGYEVFPSFEATKHWCLVQNHGGYDLESWESRESDTQGTSRLVSRSSVALPSDIGALLQQIWLNAILEARYPRFFLAGADGEMHFFAATRARDREMLWAEVWSPHGDLPPLWMTQAGAAVFAYARSEDRNEEQLRLILTGP